jgi:protein O-mannosyl-transferase
MNKDHEAFFLKPAVHILLIILCGVAVYSNTFHVPFHFDDQPNISDNPLIQDANLLFYPSQYCSQVVPGSVRYIPCYVFKNRYLGYISFALNYQINGLDVVGYHLVNILIHILNGILVYALVLMTFKVCQPGSLPEEDRKSGRLVGLFSALLFIVHPIQTQAVTYIVQRFASLATLFYLLTIVSYIKWKMFYQELQTITEGQGTQKIPHLVAPFYYFIALVSAVCAMKTKEIAFTLPVVLVLYELFMFRGKLKNRILYLVPFLLTLFIIPLSLLGIDRPIGSLIGEIGDATRVQTTLSRLDYLFTEFRVIVTYIRLLFFPINQNLDYDYPIYHSLFKSEVLLSVFLIGSILALGIYFIRQCGKSSLPVRLISFGIFWFFITLAVESSVIPIIDVIFEHRLYLPSAGASIALTTLVFFIADRVRQQLPYMKKVVIGMLVVITVVLSGVSYARNSIWKDDVTLWSDIVRLSPNKSRPYNNLGVAFNHNGQYNRAARYFYKAIQLNPNNAEAYNNLGNTFYKMGFLDASIRQYQAALFLDPYNEDAQYNLSVVMNIKGALQNDGRK